MTELFDIIRDAVNKRWSGEMVIRFYFGAIKNPKISFTPDISKPFVLPKQAVRRDEITGQ